MNEKIMETLTELQAEGYSIQDMVEGIISLTEDYQEWSQAKDLGLAIQKLEIVNDLLDAADKEMNE